MPISLPDILHIEHLKLVGYLLNLHHPHGNAKARAFLGYGFAASEPERLASALFENASSLPCRFFEGRAGTRLVFEGALRTPRGVILKVRSVSLLETGEQSARLLTAYPFDER